VTYVSLVGIPASALYGGSMRRYANKAHDLVPVMS
jgi:hypothetical protein